MRQRSKKQGHAYICAHWQPLSSDRNCYKGVPMSDTETAETPEPSETQHFHAEEAAAEIESVEEEHVEPEQVLSSDECLSNDQAEAIQQEEIVEPVIIVERAEDPEKYPEVIEEPPSELVEANETTQPVESEDIDQDITSSEIPIETEEGDTFEEEPIKEEEVKEKSEEMVDTVHNFHVDVSPSMEKRSDYGTDKNREEAREESCPEPVTVQLPRTEAELVELENERADHEEPVVEQQEQTVADREDEKVLTPEPVARPSSVQEKKMEESKEEMKPIATKPVTGIKIPSARTTIPPPKPKTAVPSKMTPSPAVSKSPTTAVKTPSKTAPMSRPPAPFKASPAPPRPKAAPPRSQSQHRTSASRNGSTTKMDSLPNTPKLVNRKYQNVQSRVGSITDHKPQGGNVEIFSEKKTYKAESKIGSLHNAEHKPGGGNVKIETAKLNFKDIAKPKIDAVSNHTPKQSDKKIPTQRLSWNVQSKIGSLDNATHKAGGGQVKILNQKLEWNAESKVGSTDNIRHRPGGGNVQIFDEKLEYIAPSKVGSGRGSEKSF